ncbi:MAG: hypothetical protein H6Q31_955 [Bacteroidetes bacterium]|jgi:hypothetical protein|nr:hypothetical protein [Bacteroidota bacterium]
MEENQKLQLLFTQLVLMFHAACAQQLGKVKHPITDKLEKDLPAAQSTIDMLDMLHQKTRGNLSAEEEQLLTQVISELKLTYVQEART